MRYYRNFWIFMNNPPGRRYLRWAYKKGIEDLSRLNFSPDFRADHFTCLLCGVANEGTAEEFIKFTLQQNPRAQIWIIDRGKEQIDAVKKMVRRKFADLPIRVERIDILALPNIVAPESFDWIETDAFMEFFNMSGLEKLFAVWRSLLKLQGFITTRDYATDSALGSINDTLRIWQMRIWLGVKTFAHSPSDFDRLFKKFDFQVAEGPTFIPTFRRFTMIKSEALKVKNNGDAQAQ